VVITNYEENQSELLPAQNNPEREEDGTRTMPFSKHLYIEKSDFMEDPPKKFFRLSPGGMVRLKNAYIIICDRYIKDDTSGDVIEVHCRYVPESKSGQDTSGLKVKGTIHWVSAPHAINVEVRLYDRLFTDPTPDSHENQDFLDFFNEDSLRLLSDAKVEPFLKEPDPHKSYQFLRNGYFTLDEGSNSDKLIFNKTIGLKDNWKP
jgi:glutaminyl-tRNA synthetase